MSNSRFLDLIALATGGSGPQTKATRTLIALDLGGTTGWAMWRDGVVTLGSIDLTKSKGKRFEGPGMKFVRFSRFLRNFPPADCISFEEVRRHRGVAAAHAYGGYLSHLTAFCDSQDPQIPYEGIGVAAIKQRATGNGAAKKEMMVDACCGKLGIIPSDDNEADAAWLLVLLVEAEGLEWPGGAVEPPPAKKKKKAKRKARKSK